MKKGSKKSSKKKNTSLNSSLYGVPPELPEISSDPSSFNINYSNNFKTNSVGNVSNNSSASNRDYRLFPLGHYFHNFFQRLLNRNRKNKNNDALSKNKNKKSKDKTSQSITQPVSSSITQNEGSNEYLHNGNMRECPLCVSILEKENFPPLKNTLCPHQSCYECMNQYLFTEITESRVNIACPECPEPLHPNDIRDILENDSKLYNKYEEFMLRRVLTSDPDARWCPAPNCNFVVIASGCASCPKIFCLRPGCGTTFCYHCKQHWHPNQTCDAAKAERSSSSSNFKAFPLSQESTSNSDIKSCPRCQSYIIKMDDGSCNHMTCAICGAEFCWLCMKEISDLHYLSPSGCTFWGKKPWSQKKKILWQLGTLVGAPVGIVLIAGIAVPTIIIGVPVWVARRVYQKCSYMSAHKRNLSIAGGIISSTLVSPLLAALAVGIGVPILLAYVYGVVPISLCRSGGCGVHAGDNEAVMEMQETKLQMSEEDPSVKAATTADTRSVVEGSTHGGVANPSIGPSIGEMSLAMTNSLSASGSHLERVGVIQEDGDDRDSASHKAMAGSCVVESLSGSILGGGFANKLEVKADVAPTPAARKRSSFSSDSNNLSIENKSVSVSFGDNVSVVFIDNNSSFGNNIYHSNQCTSLYNNVHTNNKTTSKSKTSSQLHSFSPPNTHPPTFNHAETHPDHSAYKKSLADYLCDNKNNHDLNDKNKTNLNEHSTNHTTNVTFSRPSCLTSLKYSSHKTTTTTATTLRSSFQRCSSPTSSRSVSFKTSDPSPVTGSSKVHPVGEPGTFTATKTSAAITSHTGSKKQSMSMGDNIDGESNKFSNSVHSLLEQKSSYQQVKQPLVNSFMGGSDIFSMVMAVMNEENNISLTDNKKRAVSSSTVSSDIQSGHLFPPSDQAACSSLQVAGVHDKPLVAHVNEKIPLPYIRQSTQKLDADKPVLTSSADSAHNSFAFIHNSKPMIPSPKPRNSLEKSCKVHTKVYFNPTDQQTPVGSKGDVVLQMEEEC